MRSLGYVFRSLALSLIVAVSTSACSSSYTTPVAVGGLGGAALGAGTGALVGTVIANGDVAASALMGGAIGLPVGLAVGAIYHYNSEEKVAERKGEVIKRNQEEIFARQRELESLRDELKNESFAGNPAEANRQYHFSGETLGNYYR
jgi:hypothetical protein